MAAEICYGIVSLLHDKSEYDLHAAIHNKQNNSPRTLLPLEACTLCARWLLSVGKNIQLSLQSIDGDACLRLTHDQKPPPKLLAYLDYLAKWPRCSMVLEDDANLSAVKHSLISAVLTTLRTDVRFDPLDSRTIEVIKFVLETNKVQSPEPQKTASAIFTSEKRKRLRAGKSSADIEEDALTLLIAMFPPLLRGILVAFVYSIRCLLFSSNNTTGEPHATIDFFASTFSPVLFTLLSSTKANEKEDWRIRFLYHLLNPERPARSFGCLMASVFGRNYNKIEKVDPIEPLPDQPKQTRSIGLQTSASTGEICKVLSTLNLTTLADSPDSPARLSMLSAPLGDSTNLSQTSKITARVCSAEAQQLRSNIALSLGRWRQADDPQRLAKLESSAELLQLLNHILLDRSMDPRVKLRHLKQFQISHGDVFWLRFGDVQTANDYFRRLRQRIDKLPSSPSGISKLGNAIKVKKGSLPPTS
ncbi:unnamed protein product [Schistocephalus solidus]|uniref:Ras-GAP domain-containing protein n=1 Tax=Schistocephalus solidus TaxID=70667 RepID=A0A183SIG0_SCHSO|nr:unnamed protein product [Schistocephalus solidus]